MQISAPNSVAERLSRPRCFIRSTSGDGSYRSAMLGLPSLVSHALKFWAGSPGNLLRPLSGSTRSSKRYPNFSVLAGAKTCNSRWSARTAGLSTCCFRVLFRTPAKAGDRFLITDITTLKETKRRLAESEARYRNLVEDQSELVSLATPDGRLLYVNSAYASLRGMQPHESIGKNLFDFVPPDARADLAHHFRNVCDCDGSLSNENQVVLPDGRRRRIGWTNRALTDGSGQVTIHSVGRDIDARLVAERLLQGSEERYRFLAENSIDMILLLGKDGKRYYASPSSRTLLGYEPEEMLATDARQVIHAGDIAKVLRVLATGAIDAPLPFRMRRKNGSYVWVEGMGRAISSANQPPRILVVIRDITQRIDAEQRLRESEARYRLLAENCNDMVFQLDTSLVRRYVSPACRDVLGYEPQEMCGVSPIHMAHLEDAPRLALVFQSLLGGETDRQSIVNRIRHRKGPWIWVEV